jgi:hypothetical protein
MRHRGLLCRLPHQPRSSYYGVAHPRADTAGIFTGTCPTYGIRRTTTQVRLQDQRVNQAPLSHSAKAALDTEKSGIT